jgi:hypothetical protein
MLREIPSRLLMEWMAFYGLEPFGYEADFQGHALTASVIAEVNRNTKKRKEPFTIKDFMPVEREDEDDKPSVFAKLKDYFKNVNSR